MAGWPTEHLASRKTMRPHTASLWHRMLGTSLTLLGQLIFILLSCSTTCYRGAAERKPTAAPLPTSCHELCLESVVIHISSLRHLVSCGQRGDPATSSVLGAVEGLHPIPACMKHLTTKPSWYFSLCILKVAVECVWFSTPKHGLQWRAWRDWVLQLCVPFSLWHHGINNRLHCAPCHFEAQSLQ